MLDDGTVLRDDVACIGCVDVNDVTITGVLEHHVGLSMFCIDMMYTDNIALMGKGNGLRSRFPEIVSSRLHPSVLFGLL